MATDTLDPGNNGAEDVVTVLAGIIVSKLGATVESAVRIATALVDNGVTVDLARASDWAEINATAARVLAEEGEQLWGNLAVDVGEGSLYGEVPPQLRPEVLAAAEAERLARLGALAKQSASQLVPDPAIHAEIDRLLG